MPEFSGRSNAIEIMDDLNCTGKVLEQTLLELEIINKWLGGNRITLDSLDQLLKSTPEVKEVTIVDLGCGGGDMLRLIDVWGKKRNLKMNLIGIDANPYIISFAKKNQISCPQIQFQTLNIFDAEFRNQKFDIVIGTLFYHHFTNQQLSQFFSQLKNNIRIGLIINDIHRHWLAYYSIKFLTQTFSKSSMVKFDAPLSVLRAFRKNELAQILKEGQIENFTIQWRWAFRWQGIARITTPPLLILAFISLAQFFVL